MISIRDARRSPADKSWIENNFEHYLDDLMRVSLNTGMFPVFGEFGDRQPDMMARWFADDSSHPLVILHNDKPTGFALVSKPVMKRSDVDYRLAEFFVDRNARRHGVGREAAELIFNRFDGRWEVVEMMRNQTAVAFWRAVVSAYAQGQNKESVQNGEMRQLFRSDPTHGRIRKMS
ncbi:MAG: GNAT family N-acetyltransferase [Candidatus Obscuribacterales bacterium]|nr:GNAT family N-acetyltransferase [Steroidobacteraceae bacterium]